MLGVAIVGCGLIGAKRARALPPDARLVVVHDVDAGRAAEVASLVDPPARVAPGLDDLLATPDVALVVVATPHHELASIAAQAATAGRHVLVEKPGARSVAELEEVRAAARDARVTVQVGFNHRFHPALLEARRLVHDGGYGRVLHVRGRYGHGGRLGYEREWRAQRELSGGGELIDQGIHLVDLTRYLGGDVDLAFSELRTEFWAMDVEDNAYLALRLRAGGFAWLHASWTEWKNLFSLEVALETAKVEVTGLGGSYGTETLTLHEMRPELGPPDTSVRTFDEPDASWARELDDVVAAVGGDRPIGASIEDGIAALAVVEEAYRR